MTDRLFDPINNFPDVKPNEGIERNQPFEFYDSEGDSWKEYHSYSWIEVEEKLIDVFFQKPIYLENLFGENGDPFKENGKKQTELVINDLPF